MTDSMKVLEALRWVLALYAWQVYSPVSRYATLAMVSTLVVSVRAVLLKCHLMAAGGWESKEHVRVSTSLTSTALSPWIVRLSGPSGGGETEG